VTTNGECKYEDRPMGFTNFGQLLKQSFFSKDQSFTVQYRRFSAALQQSRAQNSFQSHY